MIYTSARYERKAMDWTVFPRPISSAKIPLIPLKSIQDYNFESKISGKVDTES